MNPDNRGVKTTGHHLIKSKPVYSESQSETKVIMGSLLISNENFGSKFCK